MSGEKKSILFYGYLIYFLLEIIGDVIIRGAMPSRICL